MFRRRVAAFQSPAPSLTLYKHRIFTLSRNIKAYKVDGSAVSLLLVILFCYLEWRWKKSGCRGAGRGTGTCTLSDLAEHHKQRSSHMEEGGESLTTQVPSYPC